MNNCLYSEKEIVDARKNENGSFVRRWRECIKCSNRFRAYDRLERIFAVVKNYGGDRKYIGGQQILEKISDENNCE